METAAIFVICLAIYATTSCSGAESKSSFDDNFSIMWSENHFKTSEDGQIWYLSLDKDTGTYIFISPIEQLSIDKCFSMSYICLMKQDAGFKQDKNIDLDGLV